MIIRDYQQKEVMLISDFPLDNEIKRGTSYTEYSQINLKDSLNTASFNACRDSETKHLLNSTTVCFTYLSISRYAKGDFDWQHSIVSKRNIPVDHNYYQIPWLKDVWVSPDIWYELQDLIKQIKEVKPKIIVLAGKWSFLLLATLPEEPTKQLTTIAKTKSKPTSKKWFGALNTYRSSILTLQEGLEIPFVPIVYPILTPAYLFLIKEKQFVVNRDYAKLARIHREVQEGADVSKWLHPLLKTELGLTLPDVTSYLEKLYVKLQEGPVLVAMDIETRQGYTDCIGIAYSHNHSLTIPYSYMEEEVNETEGLFGYLTKNKVETYQEVPIGEKILNYKNFWTLEEELAISELLWKVMLHPNCRHVGQNYNYDCQYYFHQWKLKISSFCDTMILHHVLYNYMQKDLAFLASIYCDYFVYWKDELHSNDNETRWKYNGKDCIYTLIIADLLLQIINVQSEGLKAFYQFQQFKVVPNIVTIMNRGVKVDTDEKERLRIQFTELMEGCLEKINYIFNEEVNLNSTPQVKRAFKDLLGIKPVLNRKTKRESFGSDAMLVYLEAYPEWRTLLTLFLEYKSIKVFVKTFLSAKVDDDGHMRCDYNPAGTKTYRLSSRKNVFGNGMNLANVPSKGKIDLRIALQEIEPKEEEESDNFQFQTDTGNLYEGKLALPNCKNIFLPSDDKVFFDADYSAIDLHFVIWESDCQFLKDIIRAGKDVYSILASHYYQREITKKDEERQIFKSVCHGANYLGKAPTLAAKAGLSIGAVNRVLQWYFKECPEIPAWHKMIEDTCRKKRYVENIFGARFWCLDFDDPMFLNKMVAAIPQSSAAILVNKALCALEEHEQGDIQVLLQVHDSLAGQFNKDDVTAIQRIKQYMEILIPYKDPLVIPAQIKTSLLSYGDCH